MPRKFLRRIMPDNNAMSKHQNLQKFGQRLAEPKLWHLNRYSVSGGVAIGLFISFLPIFGQMLAAAMLAIIFRVNLPVAVFSTWFSNPLTYAPILFASYKLGAWLLQLPVKEHPFDTSWEWVIHTLLPIWQPLLLGSLIYGIAAALIGMSVVRLIWRLIVIRSWRGRRRL